MSDRDLISGNGRGLHPSVQAAVWPPRKEKEKGGGTPLFSRMSLLSYNLTRKRGGGRGNCGYGWTAKIVTLTKKRKEEGEKKESGWRQLAALDFTSSSSSAGSSPRSSFSTSSREGVFAFYFGGSLFACTQGGN